MYLGRARRRGPDGRRSRARIAMTGDEGRTIEGRTTPTTANATAGDERRATERRRPTDDDRRRPTIEEDAQDDRRSKGRRGDEGRGHRRRRRRRGAGRPAAFPRLAPPRGRARLTGSRVTCPRPGASRFFRCPKLGSSRPECHCASCLARSLPTTYESMSGNAHIFEA